MNQYRAQLQCIISLGSPWSHFVNLLTSTVTFMESQGQALITMRRGNTKLQCGSLSETFIVELNESERALMNIDNL